MSLSGHHQTFYEVFQKKEEKERKSIAFWGILMTEHGQGYIQEMDGEESLNDILHNFVTPMKRAMQIASLKGELSIPDEEELDHMILAESLLSRLNEWYL